MPNLRIMKAIVGVVKESTPFTYLEPTATDAWPAFDIEVTYEGDAYERKDTTMHFGKALEIAGPATGTINFKLVFVGGTATAVAPFYATALQAAGLRQEITAATNVTYKPWSTFDGTTGAGPPAFVNPGQAYTVAVWEDGIQYAIKGAQGNVKLVCKMGEPMVWEFSFKGAYVAPQPDSFPAITVSSLSPPTFLGATLNIHSFASAVFTELTVDLGNDVQYTENANDPTGIRGAIVVNRRIMASYNPEMELPATHDFFLKWRTAGAAPMTFGPIATAGANGNKLAFNGPLVQYRVPKMGDRNSIRIIDVELPVVTTGAEGSDFSFILT